MDADLQERQSATRLRCSHCGRVVAETIHTRDAWRVDYYLLHTGDVEEATMSRDEEGGAISYWKLVTIENVVTCIDCYRDPAVRGRRDDQFHRERHAEVPG